MDKTESATVEKFLAAISPAFDAVGKFSSSEGQSVGAGGAKLARSVRRFGQNMRETAVTQPLKNPAVRPVTQVASAPRVDPGQAEPILTPQFSESLAAIGEFAALAPAIAAEQGRHVRFKTTMALGELRKWFVDATAPARTAAMRKFLDGARIVREGWANTRVPMRLGAIVLAGAVAATIGMTFVSDTHAEGRAEIYEFPITMRQVGDDGGYMRAHPSEKFMELARAALSFSIGPDRAEVHIEHSMAAFDACLSRTDPCEVSTAGFTLDAKNGRFILKAPVDPTSTYEGMALAYEEGGEIFLYDGDGGAYLRAAAKANGVELPEVEQVSSDDPQITAGSTYFHR